MPLSAAAADRRTQIPLRAPAQPAQLNPAGVDALGSTAPVGDEEGDHFESSAGRSFDPLPPAAGTPQPGSSLLDAHINSLLALDLSNGSANPPEGRAQFTQTVAPGTRGQGKLGKITINGSTYDFVSGRGRDGGGGGRGHLPSGTYTVTRHRDHRLDRSTMRVGNTGYSFALNDAYDTRVRDTRTLLRIHPDGGREGTIGCIGIIGNEATQRRFREDMLTAIAAHGGSYQLVVG